LKNGRALASAHVLRSITVDHGTEFMSRALEDWESFDGRLRDECLDVCVAKPAAGAVLAAGGTALRMIFEVGR
jgi:hypothetical protein